MKTRNRKRETAQRSVLQFSYHSHYLFGVLLLLVILLSIWIKAHVFQILLVPSGSMENTCMSGDFLLATVYDKMDIQRYDIIAFHCPDNPDLICLKRVAGLPGDCILVAGNAVYANGVKLKDSFIKEEMEPIKEGTYIVPENSYFVLGDNRNNSNDSRYWDHKYVQRTAVIAKAKYVIFPFQRIGKLQTTFD